MLTETKMYKQNFSNNFMNLYALNNPERKIPFVEGTVSKTYSYIKETYNRHYQNITQICTRFSLLEREDIFVLPLSLKLNNLVGKRVRLYEEERSCKFVELAGIEIFFEDGVLIHRKHIDGYYFKDSL